MTRLRLIALLPILTLAHCHRLRPARKQIEWEFAAVVERAHPVIAVVQQQQGMTDAQIDDLFREAAKR